MSEGRHCRSGEEGHCRGSHRKRVHFHGALQVQDGPGGQREREPSQLCSTRGSVARLRARTGKASSGYIYLRTVDGLPQHPADIGRVDLLNLDEVLDGRKVAAFKQLLPTMGAMAGEAKVRRLLWSSSCHRHRRATLHTRRAPSSMRKVRLPAWDAHHRYRYRPYQWSHASKCFVELTGRIKSEPGARPPGRRRRVLWHEAQRGITISDPLISERISLSVDRFPDLGQLGGLPNNLYSLYDDAAASHEPSRG